MVEGIGEDFLPTISDFSRVKKAYAISDKESFLAARELLEKEGILGGSSTGTLLAAALRYCREQTTPKKVLLFVRSEEHTSELQSLMRISYAVFCLKKKTKHRTD